MTKLLNALRAKAGVRSLLSDLGSNPKIKKSDKLGVSTAVLHLAPGNMSGFEVCPKRSPGCTAACLHFAGSPLYQSGKTTARIARTRLLFRDRNLFMNILVLEIAAHRRAAERKGMDAAVRLNGTSDIVWERKKFILYPEVADFLGETIDRNAHTINRVFPSVQFYDYTKIPNRDSGDNYELTFSLSEQNMNDTMSEFRRGRNIAVVFFGKVPATFMGLEVIDGDEHDYRPADPRGVVVGLKAKGLPAKADRSGFVTTNLPLAQAA